MEASKNDIKNLKKLQKIDADIKTTKSDVENLPERQEFLTVSAKLSELTEKMKKVEVMKREIDKRFEKMNTEDAQLVEREKHVQRSIDEAAGDYRNLEVHTKELDSISIRRNTLSEMMLNATVEQDKVNALSEKLTSAIEQITAKQNALAEKIKQAQVDSADSIKKLTASRDKVYKALPENISKLYDDAVGKVGNVVLASLDGNSCSVCRSPIEEGKLLEIQKQGGISACPGCGRIIIVDA